MYYPLLFDPIFKEMMWGSNRLKTIYHRNIPSDHTGESWDVSCREKEMSVISNGPNKGKTLLEVINTDKFGYMGDEFADIYFPLLVKIIDANDYLSVQVHPDDAYAQRVENYELGKNEMWYILHAPENATLIIGLKDHVSKDDFASALGNIKPDGEGSEHFENLLNRLPVKRGDMINIPAGLLHAITPGVVLAEIQQNSDITYRVYDYNRKGLDGKPRELHTAKALDVIDFTNTLPKVVDAGQVQKLGANSVTTYAPQTYYEAARYDINEDMRLCTDITRFSILTCVDGQCLITPTGNTSEALQLTEGQSAFLPAKMGEYVLSATGDSKTSGCSVLESKPKNNR